MFTAFRKVRRSIIEKGKFKSYLLYGSGEIILVVLSILLALQIDNWNENNKARDYEHYILKEIANNLKEDSIQINDILKLRAKTDHSIRNMLTYLPTKKIKEEEISVDIAHLFTFERYFPIRTAYETSKSRGLAITNEQLRTKIARYYEYEQYRVNESIKDIEAAFHKEFSPPFKDGQFVEVEYGKYIKLRDYKDEELIRFLYQLLFVYKDNHALSFLKISQFKEINEQLLKKVREELKEFN